MTREDAPRTEVRRAADRFVTVEPGRTTRHSFSFGRHYDPGNVGIADLVAHNANIRSVECPFTGERLAAVPAIRPDVAIVHAQRADRDGNVLIEGITGVQKEVVLAARRAIVTVEEIVADLRAPSPNSTVLPHWTITAIAVAPGGARPSYAHGYYARDNAFYIAWDAISRDRDQFTRWMRDHVVDASAPVEAVA